MAILAMKMACKPRGLEAHATSDWHYWTQPSRMLPPFQGSGGCPRTWLGAAADQSRPCGASEAELWPASGAGAAGFAATSMARTPYS